jgi:hypothetical protein
VQRFQTNLSHHFSEQEAVLITAAASVAALIFAEGPEYFSDAVVFVEDAKYCGVMVILGSGGLLGAAHGGHFFGGNIRWAEMPPMGGRLPMGAF